VSVSAADPSTGRLVGRVALVTGAAGGIGTAIASRLAAEGAIVIASDLDPRACRRVPSAAKALPADVSDPASVERVVADIDSSYGRLDVLVNNAGIARDAPVHRMSDEEWSSVYSVGLWGAFCTCRAAAGLLRRPASHHRKVVNMSSSVGVHGAAGTANYAAAKAGLLGLTKALAREWAHLRINVNAVAPGLIAGTAMTAAKPADLVARIADQVPIGRPGTVDDVAAAVAYLSSEDADYVTGQVLELDGGLSVPT
jgi:3-oxoacyl-[acyl-carrier protein] reductase